jgi:sialic acid synthase SpsE
MKSVVATRNLPAGTVLTGEHLTVKKPGTGIPAYRLAELIGRRLRRDFQADELLVEDELEVITECAAKSV